GTTALAALLVKPVLDQIFVDRDTSRLLFFPLLILLLYVVRGLLSYGHAYLMRSVGQQIIRDMRDQVFAHIQSLPLLHLQAHHTGAWMSRMLSDVALMERAVTSAANDVLRQGLTMVGLIGVAVYRDWFLALCAIGVLPVASLLIMQLARQLRGLNRRAQEQLEQLSAVLAEVFSSLTIVKGFGREAYERERFQQRNTAYYRTAMRATRADEISAPIMECLGALGVAAVVWYGGHQVIAGVTTPGTFFSFLTAIFMLYEPMRKLSRVNNTIQGALAAAERTFAVLDTPDEWVGEAQKPALPPLQHRLTFTDVALRYHPDSPLALHNINLEVMAGEVIALVGASGAGKTSLVHLLPRFYEVTDGGITIDGVDIRQISLASLRAQIGIVSQDIVLFDDTLWQNIRYGHLQASDAQVQEAARAAYAHDFIMHMPQGYDTLIGERGVRLSGGEKQRIAIARALLRNAPILILDEATSALDSASEQVVQYALANLMKDRTTFVIAHRLATIRHASKIVVMHAGTIVEVGSHAELLRHTGYYSELYHLQFKSQE
ncbi:MAG: ABC transporter ATP-binding protein, partial [Candidatus Tectomicrobia bacterium]|nr:ABC transporter ATP-binding protein [Candidatus Tectomicrobia bacterium]